jgi:hypothetical protein
MKLKFILISLHIQFHPLNETKNRVLILILEKKVKSCSNVLKILWKFIPIGYEFHYEKKNSLGDWFTQLVLLGNTQQLCIRVDYQILLTLRTASYTA